ncbi:hypothetical protein CAC42_3547 [Sphaceloma murrayae]|uniref:Chromatin assembly factor 1 subunit rlf2 n=1 Tax=Sphaceloma murrayae TaxID=2082308 RepID=A0A2K1R1M8_9PEZI|nr:hypothetical protein CAC42_3547 [Sphaceloma murrayae]
MPTPPNSTSPSDKNACNSPRMAHREVSPTLSTSTLSSVPTSTAGSNPVQTGSATLNGSSDPPAKRRKLTPAERLQRDREKEDRARQKEERKAQREIEAAAKAEERRAKNEEREIKQREKDLLKQQRDEERRKKEEEIAKKQRAQMRLGAFFTRPGPAKPASIAPHTAQDDPSESATSKDSKDLMTGQEKSVMTCPTMTPSGDYQRHFLPFSIPQHTTLAATAIQSSMSDDERRKRQEAFDGAIFSQNSECQRQPGLDQLFPSTGLRFSLPPRASLINELLQGTSSKPIDLTTELAQAGSMSEILEAIDMKHIHFSEDVRPPYTGSYTRISSQSRARKLARVPISRQRDDTNYDYDSEAEWEEPEDGEEVLSEEEDDAESTGSAEDMEEFLDDGDEQDTRNRKLITSELQPVSSGICWEATPHAGVTDGPFDLESMRLEWLLEGPIKTINPFSDSYWTSPVDTPSTGPHSQAIDLFGRPVLAGSNDTAMKPPRTPLVPTTSNANSQKHVVNAVSGAKGPLMAVKVPKVAKAAAPKLVGKELEALKEAVIGSNLTKVELLKALKSRFPQFTNDSIKETVASSFARVGPTAADKRWHVIAA